MSAREEHGDWEGPHRGHEAVGVVQLDFGAVILHWFGASAGDVEHVRLQPQREPGAAVRVSVFLFDALVSGPLEGDDALSDEHGALEGRLKPLSHALFGSFGVHSDGSFVEFKIGEESVERDVEHDADVLRRVGAAFDLA